MFAASVQIYHTWKSG